MKYNNLSHKSIDLIMYSIEKQRMELIRIVEKHQYNFLNIEVITASIEMDHWLNLYQQSSKEAKTS